MAKRERVQLAHKYDPKKNFIVGFFLSEKLDGMRCYWDGGITRGMIKKNVPWANCEKDDRYVNTEVSTGLWSRLGNVVHAPDWWIDELPPCPADGELWEGYHVLRQDIISKAKKLVPVDDDWTNLKYHVYGLPSYEEMFPAHADFIRELIHETTKDSYVPKSTLTFRQEYYLLKKHCGQSSSIVIVGQKELSFNGQRAKAEVEHELEIVCARGGEGIMLRDPNKSYECIRSYNLLKYKPHEDSEAVVTGYITGRETDKGSKLLGLMGAMIVEWKDGVVFKLSGFTVPERKLEGFHRVNAVRASHWATDNPESECPLWVAAEQFPRGSKVTFKYRGLSKDGVPNEARYFRKDTRF